MLRQARTSFCAIVASCASVFASAASPSCWHTWSGLGSGLGLGLGSGSGSGLGLGLRLGSGLGSVADLTQARGELGVERALELDDLGHLVRVRVRVRVRVGVGVSVRVRVRVGISAT